MNFVLSGVLKRHMLTHTAEKRFKCEMCQINFGGNRDLKKHIILMHIGETSLKQCCDPHNFLSDLDPAFKL